jgi:hypothetical protein
LYFEYLEKLLRNFEFAAKFCLAAILNLYRKVKKKKSIYIIF